MKSTVDAEAFAAAVKSVSGILKKNDVPQLAQVRVQFADDACRVSATDMAAWLSADIPAAGAEFSFVFRNTKKLLRVLSHLKGELTVEPFGAENDPKVYLHTSDMVGEFPVLEDTVHEEIPRIVPKHRYAVNPETLRLRVESVSYATSIRKGRPASAGVRFQDKRIWSVDGYRMAIHEDDALAYLTDCTNAKEQIYVEFDGGRLIAHDRHGTFAAKVEIADGRSEVRYAFNLAYMKQALEHLKDVELVQINAISEISPVVLRGDSVTAMVLPLRMKEATRAKAA